MKWIQVKAQWKCQQIFAISETSSARSSIRRAIRTSPYGSWGTESPGRFFWDIPRQMVETRATRIALWSRTTNREPSINSCGMGPENQLCPSLKATSWVERCRTQTRKRSRWRNFHLSPLVSIFFWAPMGLGLMKSSHPQRRQRCRERGLMVLALYRSAEASQVRIIGSPDPKQRM